MFLFLLTSGECRGSSMATTIGSVRDIKDGVLERQHREVWNPLTVNAEIRANARIRTGAGATAVISLSGIGSVTIGPSTGYYLCDPAQGFKTLLKRGYLRASTQLKPDATMSVATTSAVTGVRGTKFSVIQDAQGMDLCTCKGEVQVTFKDGKSVTVASGMFGSVNAGGK
jgi:ferric-dicitrate binding protein FerR (iron transport regulator)